MLFRSSAVEVARALGYGRDQGVGPDGETAKFDHPHGCAANFGDRSVENELAALQQAEALNEQVNSDADSDDAPKDGAGVLRTEKGCEDGFRWDQGSGCSGLGTRTRSEASGTGSLMAVEKLGRAYVGNWREFVVVVTRCARRTVEGVRPHKSFELFLMLISGRVSGGSRPRSERRGRRVRRLH